MPIAPVLAVGAGVLTLLAGATSLTALMWLIGTGVIVASPLWQDVEKVVGAGVALGGLTIMLTLDRAALVVTGQWSLVPIGSILITVLAVYTWLWSRGASRVADHRPRSTHGDSAVPLLQQEWVPVAAIMAYAAGAVLLWLGTLIMAFLGVLGLLAAVVLLTSSPLWRPRELLFAIPVLLGGEFLLLAVGPWFELVRTALDITIRTSPNGPSAGLQDPRWILVGLALAVMVAMSAWLLRRGAARASQASREGTG